MKDNNEERIQKWLDIYADHSEKERKAAKRRFLAIPEEYRCDPFDISPSGDLYWADKRNVDEIKSLLKEPRDKNKITIKSSEALKSFFDSL